MTISDDGTARVWNAEEGSEEAVYRPEHAVLSAAFAPDSDRVVLTDQRGHLRIARVSSGEVRLRWEEIKVPYVDADFGPEGRQVIVAAETTRVHIHDVAGGEIVATLSHPARVKKVAFSPDKRWIATAADDAVVRIWDAARRESWLEIKRGPGRLPGPVHFAADSRRIVIQWDRLGDPERLGPELIVYPLDVPGEAQRARFGDLTPDEREHFQVGSPEERRQHRAAWRGGDVFGEGPAAER